MRKVFKLEGNSQRKHSTFYAYLCFLLYVFQVVDSASVVNAKVFGMFNLLDDWMFNFY